MSRIEKVGGLSGVLAGAEAARVEDLSSLASLVMPGAAPLTLNELARGTPLALPEPSDAPRSASDDAAVRRADVEHVMRALGVSEAHAAQLLARAARELAARGIDMGELIDELTATSHPLIAAAIPVLLTHPELATLVPGLEPSGLTSELDTRLMAHAAAHFADTLFSSVDAAAMPLERALRLGVLSAPKLIELSPAEMLLAPIGVAGFLDAPGAPPIDEGRVALVAGLVYAQPRAFLELDELQGLHDEAVRRDLEVSHGTVERGLRHAAWLCVRRTSDAATADAVTRHAAQVTHTAMPRVVLSAASAARRDEDTPDTVRAVVERLEPRLAEWERAVLAVSGITPMPRAQLCDLLHAQLTRAPDQVFLALLSLLRRHNVWATRRGVIALRRASRGGYDELELARIEGTASRVAL